MFLTALLRTLLGTVTFSVRGGMPERFLNLAGQEGVHLWNIRRQDGGLRACVRAGAFHRLRGPVRKSRVRPHILKKSGMPFVVHRYRLRWGLAAGTALFLLLLWFFSGFVWTVEVSGNRAVSEKDIVLALEDCGLAPGCWRPALNIRSLERRMLLKLPGLSWIAVNIRGSHADVRVRERVYPPEVVDESVPCNVKALRAGRILVLEAYEGKAMVKPGEAVAKGDLLVSGTVEEKDGVTRLVHASAKVMARTTRTLVKTVSFRQKTHVKTGEKKRLLTLIAGGWEIPLHLGKAPKGPYARYVTRSPVTVLGVRLPLSIRTSVYTRYTVKTVTLSRDEAVLRAKAALARMKKKEFAGIRMLAENDSVKEEKSSVTVKGVFLCEENIAYQDVIKIT